MPWKFTFLLTLFGPNLILWPVDVKWCGPAHKHQQGPVTCSKWSDNSVQVKDIERGIECIGFKGFDQVRFEGSIGVSRGGPSTSYPFARGAQSNLIWAMRWGQQRKQKNPTTTWKQHGWLPFSFVSRINRMHGRLYINLESIL
jgi:hypothetical protein